VADDELSAPLGRKPKKQGRRIKVPVTVPQLLAAGLASFVLACAGWALMVDDPLGGEPMAVVATGFDGPKRAPAVVAAGNPQQGPRSYDGPDGPQKQAAPPLAAPSTIAVPPQQAGAAPGTRTVTIIDGSTGKRQEVPIPSAAARDPRAPLEQRLLETSKHGAIPRIAPDGARPSELYARPLGPQQARKDGPRIAIVVGGLGVSANLTEKAIEKLPGPVTFAFPPYGTDIERLATRARAEGHEVLLHAPMEPFDYPDNDPGPQTLLTTLPADQNVDRLHWQMSRFQGYVGIINFMGGRFSSTEQALAPVLKEAAKRGLVYVDDGASPRSVAGQIAGANNLPFAKSEVTIDSVPTPASIDKALARLEAIARERGSAVGFASAVPASIDRIAQWAKLAEGRGFILVPITAVAIKPKSS
jgi:polysaccharide deacetylase 2 family uncharacterized protein YibQ